MKKLLACVLSLAMAAGLLAGCGSKGQESAESTVPAQESTAQQEETASVPEPEQEEKELVSLRMVMYGDMTTRREEFLKGEFHDAVLNDLNIDLSVEFLPWGAADNTVPTMLASGEAFAVWNIVSAFDWPSKGYLAPIDEELIREKCPNLIRIRTENNGFDCVKQDGKIYAIPFGCKPYAGRMQTFEVRNDILKSVGYEASEITTYDQLMEAVAAVKEAYPNLRILRDSGFLINALNSEISDQLISIISGTQFAYVDESEESDTVYSLYESEAFKNLCAITSDWVEKGYIQQDELSNPTQGAADWEAGNCLLMYGTPGALIETSFAQTVPEAELALIQIGDMPYIKSIDYDWGFSISASDADHVDRWLELFDWMYKDVDTYNFSVYGVQGKDWEYNEDGTIKKLVSDSFFDGWFMEAMEYNIYDPAISEENIAQYESNDDGSILSKTSGFSFDSTAVSSELAMMTSVWTEYLEPMTYGFIDYDENYEDVIGKLKDAGLDAYMAEYQKQYSEWYANNR